MASTRRPLRRAPAPVQSDGAAIVAAVAGTVAWAAVFVVLLFLRGTLDDHHAAWWIWIPVAGFCIGLAGIVFTVRHRARACR